MLNTKEHYDLMDQFERTMKGSKGQFGSLRYDREKDKSSWVKGFCYEHAHTNEIFLSFRLGYMLGRCVERDS